MRLKFVAMFLLLASFAGAQEVPRAGETVEVAIVNVDVVVTDRAGNRVRGLEQQDFEIRENGKVQPISNFAEYVGDVEQGTVGVDVAAGQPATPVPAPRRERRNLAIFFEELQLTAADADAFARSLKETVKRLIGPDDAVSVVIWGRGKTKHIEFTSDPEQIEAAIDSIAEEAKGARPDPLAAMRFDLAQRRALNRESQEFFGGGGGGPGGGGGGNTGGATSTEAVDPTLYMLMALEEMGSRVNAINSTINSMAGLDGRKILLLAVRRLSEIAGGDIAFESGITNIPSQIRSRFNTDALMKSITDNANSSGVTIYPVNPPGLSKEGPDTEHYHAGELDVVSARGATAHRALLNETLPMERIAEATGGLLATGPQAIVDLLPKIATDASDYYSLAYRVKSSNTDRARSIVVRTTNPAYTVRARTQFVEKSDDSRMRDRLRSALFRAEQNQANIRLAASAKEVKRSRNKATMKVEVRVPIGSLTLLPQANGKHAGSFAVYVGVAGDLDEISDITRKTQQFEISPADLERARQSHFTYELDVEVNEKAKYLAVAVLDETGREFGLTRVELPVVR